MAWKVFEDGYHKGRLYPPAEIDQIAANFARLKGHLTPKAGLGHDKGQRLTASLGLPNVGHVTDVRSDGKGNLELDVANVPTWLGGMVNAGRYDDGSIELKTAVPDPGDPAKTLPGSVLDGVAILGEEQPAVKGCPPPRATFEDGTEVPPNHDPLPVPVETMAKFSAGAPGPPDKVLCFSERTMDPQIEAKLREMGLDPADYAGLPPEQLAKICAGFDGESFTGAMKKKFAEPPASPPPPPPPGDTKPDDKMAAFMDKMTAFADDVTKRLGSVEKAYSDSQKQDDEQKLAAFSAQVDDRCKKITRKVAPHLIEKVIKPAAMSILTTATFSSADERSRAFSDYFAGYEAMPDNPMLKDSIPDGKKGGARDLSAGGLAVVNALKVTNPRVVERLTTAAAS